MVPASCFRFGSWRRRQAQKDQHRAIEAQDILVVQPSNIGPNFGFRDGGDFVDHQATHRTKAVPLVWLYEQPYKRSLRLICVESADCDGIGSVKSIILHDDNRTRLARVIFSSRDRPDIAAPHSWPQSDTDRGAPAKKFPGCVRVPPSGPAQRQPRRPRPRPEGALKAYEEDLAIARKLAALRGPDDVEAQTDVVVSDVRIAQATKDPQKRKAVLEEALSIMTALDKKGVLPADQKKWLDAIKAELVK